MNSVKSGNVGDNVENPIPPAALLPNAVLHLVNAAGGIFSQEPMVIYPTMETAQKYQLASYLFKKLFQDDSIKKAQDEAVKKQQELTKENIKNEIRFEKEKTKKSVHNQRYMDNLLTWVYKINFFSSPDFSWLSRYPYHAA